MKVKFYFGKHEYPNVYSFVLIPTLMLACSKKQPKKGMTITIYFLNQVACVTLLRK